MIKRVYGARDNEGRFASWPRVPSERRPPGPALWMETMFLVAGLAVAGLVGIAAAFYFSIRSGNRGDKRLRSAGAGRAGADRHPGSRTPTARPDLNGHPRRTAGGSGPVTTFRPAASPRPYRPKADTGPDPVADFDQVPAGDRRAAPGAAATRGGNRRSGTRTAEPVAARRLGDTQALPEDPWPGDAEAGNPWPGDSWPDDSLPGDPTATDPKLGAAGRGAAETRPTAKMGKPRRRVGFRKGADLDEELWPAESFGGVSDEQFWDDMASDKPLATTARTAQQDPPARNRLSGPAPGAGLITGPAAGLDTGPATDPQAVQAQADDRKRDNRGPGGGRRGRYPAPRPAPDPAAERTAIQPAYTATQPVQSMKPPLPGATQPVRVAASSSQPMSATSRPGAGSQPREAVTPPRGTTAQPRETATPPRGTAAQPRGAASQPRGAGTQPTETRRRRPSSTEEDPLTSSAFSLRPSGPVDGRSSLRARNGSTDPYDTGGSTGSHGGTSPYPYPAPSYGDTSSVTQTMSTPPYGQDYGNGNGNGNSAAPTSEPRRRNGTGSHARPEGTGNGTRPVRPAYPRDSHQANGNGGNQGSGGYPGNGSYPANPYPGSAYQGSANQGNGHRGNGHRAPYDPRDDYRRLTHQH